AQVSDPKLEAGNRATTPSTVEGDSGKNLGASRRAKPRPSDLTRSASHILAPVAPQTSGPEPSSNRTLITEAAQTGVPNSRSEASASEPAAGRLSEQSRFATRLIDLTGEERKRGRRDPVETTPMR